MRLARQLARSDTGTVAVEFAFIAPIMILMFLGTIELCNALIARQKVTTVAASAADLVAQSKSISGSQVNDIFTAIGAIMYPYPTSGSQIIISSIKEDSAHAGQYVIDWSVAQNTTAHSPGQSITIPSGIVTSGGSTILAEISYVYTPPSNAVIPSSFTMSDTFYARPRLSSFVAYSP